MSVDDQLSEAWKLHQAGRIEAAETVYRAVVQQMPEHANAWCFLGMACHDTLRFEEALDAYARALRLNSHFHIALNNQGNTFRSLGRIPEAVASFDAARAIVPDYPSAHHNQSLAYLLDGDWKNGFREYEWRWRFLGLKEPQFPQPRWDGSVLRDKRILLHVEQGLGDTLQFIRLAKLVRQRVGWVGVVAQKPLLPILASYGDVDAWVPQGGEYPQFDVHAPLLSLPLILGLDLNTLPNSLPYLWADPQLVDEWRDELDRIPGIRVAIAWQGNPDNPADKHRSVPLAEFKSLAEVPGLRLISLQKGPGTDQLKTSGLDQMIVDFGARLDEAHQPFMDTAAILKNVDLLITSDSAITHLAGALGVPTWVIVPFAPDWRWMLKRSDSPWYPGMRLFRQSVPGRWSDVLESVAAELRYFVDQRRRIASFPDRRVACRGFNCVNRSRHGLMVYNRNDAYIGRSLDRYGEFSEGEVELFRQIVRPGDVVVEAGANIGSHTVPLSRFVGTTGAVWAFEPQRIVFQTLCGNLALNSITNVVARQAALGAQPGTIFVPHLDYNSQNNFGGLSLGQYERGEPVPVETIDQLGLRKLSFLKIDVEGMEIQVLRGAVGTLERFRPILYVENDRRDRSAELIEFLTQVGYVLYWHTPPMYRSDNYFGTEANAFGSVVSVNMLCVHSSVPASIGGLRRVN